MNQTARKGLLVLVLIVCSAIIVLLQNHSYYVDLSIHQRFKASPELKALLNDHNAPIKITIFSSRELLDDLNISEINYWLGSLSANITIEQINPIKFPQKSDHYDITTDGIFVIESNSKRIDIDLIELILKNSDFSIETLQNYLLQVILNIVNHSSKSLLFVHTSPNSILTDERPLGLSYFAHILENNHIDITETNVQNLANIEASFDTTVFYKIGPNASPHLTLLRNKFTASKSSIIFSHPKYALITNQIVDVVQFHSEIIEDPTFHLMNSKNQIITDYKSSFNESFVALLPYSSLLSFEDINGVYSIADTSTESWIQFDVLEIKGPFSIIARAKNERQFFINNHLLPTNFWIQQANNQAIVEDIILSSLTAFPIIQSPDRSSSSILLTINMVFQLFFTLIILPLLLISCGFYAIRFLRQIRLR